MKSYDQAINEILTAIASLLDQVIPSVEETTPVEIPSAWLRDLDKLQRASRRAFLKEATARAQRFQVGDWIKWGKEGKSGAIVGLVPTGYKVVYEPPGCRDTVVDVTYDMNPRKVKKT